MNFSSSNQNQSTFKFIFSIFFFFGLQCLNGRTRPKKQESGKALQRILVLLVVSLFGLYGLSAQTQLGTDIDGEAVNDQSGNSVSLSTDGSVLAIGATGNDANGNLSGHVRIYQNDGNNNWIKLGDDIDGEAESDYSGISVSLSADGSTVAIGAFANDGTAENSGHVRIYRFDGTNWLQLGADINGKAIYHWFGVSVSLSSDGNVVAVGAPTAGTVGVYSFDGSSWSQLGVDISGDGRAVSLSSDGSVVAIGDRGNDNNGTDSGQVRVYSFNGSVWSQLGAAINGEAENDQSGWSVSLSANGSAVAIGSPNNDDNGTDSGHVRIYNFDGSSWTQLGTDIDGETAGDGSGQSVSLNEDGSIAVIGADKNDGNGSDSGHVRVFSFDGSNWSQRGSDINGETAGDLSGQSVSLSADGSVVAIGATNNAGVNGSYSGHTRVYSTLFFTTSETELSLSENGGAETFTVVLGAQPTNDVVFDISSNDTNEAIVSLAQLTFTTSNWYTPQTITVTGVDDAIDRDDTATINISVNDAGSDDTFDVLPNQSVSIILTDDDTAGFTLSETALTLNENGGTANFSVMLDTQPTSDVVFDISSDDTNEATVSFVQLTFTSGNWNTLQTLTVTGVDDNTNGNDSASITIAVNDSGSNDAFDELSNQTVALTLTDDGDNLPVFTNPLGLQNFSSVNFITSKYLTSSVGFRKLGLEFSNDGTKMYSIAFDNDLIVEYTLSTPYSVATATRTYELSVTANGQYPRGLAFSADGSKMFILSQGTRVIYAYDLSTPYDLSTAVIGTDSFDISSYTSLSVEGVDFNPEGTRMYLTNSRTNSSSIEQFDLSTPFEIATSSYVGTKDISTRFSGSVYGITFGNGGTQMFIGNYSDGRVVEYRLSTPYDVSTAALTANNGNVFSLSTPTDIVFSSAFDKVFILRYGQSSVYEYTIGNQSLEFPENSTTIVTDVDANDGDGGSSDTGITYSLVSDGDNDLFAIDSGTGELSFITAPDYETPEDGNTDNDYEITVTATDVHGATQLNITIEVTDVDEIAPAGYTVSIDQGAINSNNEITASFTFAGAEVGATYDYTFGSDGGGSDVTGTGTIATATDQIIGIDLSGLGDGNISLSVTLTDTFNNTGIASNDSSLKDTTAPIGYTVSIDQDPINANNENLVSFSFAGAEVSATYDYTLSSDGGGSDVTGIGTIATATDQITAIDLSGLGDGTITLSVTLTDASNNIGVGVSDTSDKDTDSDNDSIKDNLDNCPTVVNADQLDTDSDGAGNVCDADDDNDGALDTEDDFPLDENENTDTDGDGTGDNADLDDDGDGTPDTEDDFPLDENEDTDTDGDGTGDNADTDDDNDGTPDTDDAFPLDENENTDTDGDGTGDNADLDDDGDGTPDTEDDFPLDPTEDTDTDNDGTGNNADTDDDNDGTPDTSDAFPLDPTEDTDTDNDGTGNNADTDDDNDGTPDTEDDFPLDSAEDTDTDNDGIGDNVDTDDDDDGTPDTDDAFPLDATEDTDTDGDGIGDNADADDDNDGTLDAADAFPLDPTEDTDTDSDGTGDNTDTDDDGDGYSDEEEIVNGTDPLDANSLPLDYDGDGVPDSTDADDDDDGTLDEDDAFPLDDTEDTDTDNDGIGDIADLDDDGDGQSDENENACGSDPLDSSSTSPDADNDMIPDCSDSDMVIEENNPDIEEEATIVCSEAITPNGDNINDTWVIQGIDKYPSAVVSVFNRYGNEVFKAIKYNNDWNGNHRSNSEKLPSGSYYFVIDLQNGKAPINGWLFINY